MFGLPQATEIRKLVHKKLLFQKFQSELNGEKKEKFDSDISRIIITNEISEESVNIKATDRISSVFVVLIELKTMEYNDRNIILVSKLFGQNLLLVLHYEDKYQLAIYETKLLKSDWQNENEFNLKIVGLDLDTVWENLVTQVSGIEVETGNSLEEQIKIETEKEKLTKLINDLDRKARNEVQSKKKFEMFQRIKEYERRLEKLSR